MTRNVHRARTRLTIEKSRGQMGSGGELRDAAGNLFNEPSGDALLPLAPEELPVLDPDSPLQSWVRSGIRFRIPLRPKVMPGRLLRLNRT